MREKRRLGLMLSGAAAGAVSGLFGTGGGLVLVPLLRRAGTLPEEAVFTASLRIMVPVCLVSLWKSWPGIDWAYALPCLLGSAAGGLLAIPLKSRLSPAILHRLLGLLAVFGGLRLLR